MGSAERGLTFHKGLSVADSDTRAMAAKTITLTDGAYARLRALKREGESFSDIVDRLTGKVALLEIVGTLEPERARMMRRAKRDLGKRLRKGLARKGRG